ncbi:MAG: DUF58 domain-containing protein [Acidimicrobiia bacterium]|nr:DUF58 domain-containing protein [Acidimicrobiia bacterium]
MRWLGRFGTPAASSSPPSSLLVSVRTKMGLPARRKARGHLTGEHVSVHKGRSMEFDDLRHYVRGDDVKDVDWKASARTGSILLKRYVAVRKHHLVAVVDTGRSMAARAAGGEPKRDLAVMAAGVLGSIAVQHGDLVGLVGGDAGGIIRAPLRESNVHLELLLRRVHTRIDLGGAPSDLAAVLRAVHRSTNRQLILLVVTDDAPFSAELEELVRRLRVQHEILWLTIEDTVLTDLELASRDLVDVVGGTHLPAALREDGALLADYAANRRARADHRTARLGQLRVAQAAIGREADVVPAVLGLLDRTRRAN